MHLALIVHSSRDDKVRSSLDGIPINMTVLEFARYRFVRIPLDPQAMILVILKFTLVRFCYILRIPLEAKPALLVVQEHALVVIMF